MKLLDRTIWKCHALDATGDNHFYDGDQKDLFERNLKELPLDWPWRTKKIQYWLNSQFYRAPEWQDVDWSNSYLIFGCSQTFGVGVNYDDTYAHHLSEFLGYPTVNLGMPGSSCLFQWSNTITLLNNNVKPRGAIYLWPGITRTMTFKDDGGTVFYGPWVKEEETIRKFEIDNIEHYTEFTRRLVDSVDLMWSCPTHHFHLDKDACDKIPKLNHIHTQDQPVLESARDYQNGNSHCGVKNQFYWATQMFDIIKKS